MNSNRFTLSVYLITLFNPRDLRSIGNELISSSKRKKKQLQCAFSFDITLKNER